MLKVNNYNNILLRGQIEVMISGGYQMELRFMESNTEITILECTGGGEIERSYSGVFYDMDKGLSFLTECERLNHDADSIGPNGQLRIEFFRGSRLYAFNGKLNGRVVKNNKTYVSISQISDIKESTHRTTTRIEITVNITAYESMTHLKSGDVMAQGLSLDISGDGICLLTNQPFPSKDSGHQYILDFYIGSHHFLMPAHLMRRGDSVQFVQFKYDYGFAFDFTNNPDGRSRLLMAMLDYRLQNKK